jgi:hypothetical protein
VILQYVGPRMKALLYIFGDLVMFVVALDRPLLVLRDGARLAYKFGR